MNMHGIVNASAWTSRWLQKRLNKLKYLTLKENKKKKLLYSFKRSF